jgi:hypothetical protein
MPPAVICVVDMGVIDRVQVVVVGGGRDGRDDGCDVADAVVGVVGRDVDDGRRGGGRSGGVCVLLF